MKTHTHNDIEYIRISELPEDEQQPFAKWMCGQTMPLIPDLVPQDAVYPWDYQVWKEQRNRGKKNPIVWD